jgi:hypothetical protein
MLKGSLATGDVTRLQVSDDSRIGVSAGVSGGQYYTDWYASVFLLHPPLDLTVTTENSFTVTRTQTLYAYNWSTAAWDQVNSGSVSTTDVTKTWTPAAVASYVGPSREVRFRVKGSNRNSTYTSRGDFMKFEYDYAAGTAPMAVTAGSAGGDAAQASAAERIELTASPNPAVGGTTLEFALARDADVKLEVFDVQGRLVATPLAGRQPAGAVRASWNLRDAAGRDVLPGLYFARLETLGHVQYARVTVLTR